MKLQLIIITCFILTVSLFSCKKTTYGIGIGNNGSGNPPPVILPPAPDTLKGKEFIFTGIRWEMGYSEMMEVNFPFLETPERADLFGAYRNKQVWMQKDTGMAWKEVQNFYQSGIPDEYFFYFSGFRNRLAVLSNRFWDTAILNMTGSIKIKFL